jgi:hypothetical protein
MVIEYGVAKMRQAVQATWVAVLVFLGPAAAIAQSDAPQALERGRAAERALDFEQALEAYESAISEGSGTRAGRRAEQRVLYLRERQDPDGSFASLAILERMRRAEPTDESLSELERASESMPEGIVRDDALFLLAEAWFRRRDDPARALPIYERLRGSPTLPSARRRTVGVAIAEARAALGETDEALRTIEEEGLEETFEGRSLEARFARDLARKVALGLFAVALLALLALGRPARPSRAQLARLSWKQLAAVAYVIGVPAAIAEIYEATMGEAFLYYAAVAVPLLAIAALSSGSLSVRRASRARRALFVTTLICANLAGAWLALDLADGLGGFGFP